MMSPDFTFRAKILSSKRKVSEGTGETSVSLQWPCGSSATHSLREGGEEHFRVLLDILNPLT